MDSPTVVEAHARAAIDLQISTAKRFPRSVKKFMDDATTLSTINEEVAASCFYSLPRDGKRLMGPSVRLAEIVASSYGNLHCDARIVHEDDRFITAQAVVWDVEKNLRVSVELRRRITKSDGKKYKEDMIAVTGQAAQSIALRNAIFKVVPASLVHELFRNCVKVSVGDEKTLASRRTQALDHFAKLGIDNARVFKALDVKGAEDIDIEALTELRGMVNALREGTTTLDDLFPDESKRVGPSGADAVNKLAGAMPSQAPTPAADASGSQPAGDGTLGFTPAEPAKTKTSSRKL